MGAKRPVEEEAFPELSCKHAKPIEHEARLGSDTEELPSLATALKFDSPGEAKSNICASQVHWRLENDDMDDAFISEKENDANRPSSSISNCNKEVAENDDIFLSYFPEYVPWRPPKQYEDAYTYFLTTAPRKKVPVSFDHQAEVPEWDLNASGKDASGSHNFDDDNREPNFLGTCIIPMPRLNDSCTEVAHVCGRMNCSCQIMGSARCIQQHVKEARDSLREALGEVNFGKLGFYDMGEEVAEKWTAEEEKIFQDIIFANPPAQGKNFWKCLNVVFPTRKTKELVSYYFNAFMLRRRSIQNRSYYRYIDSDDEYGLGVDYCRNVSLLALNTSGGGELKRVPFYEVEEEDDSMVESLGDSDSNAGLLNEFGPEDEILIEDEDNNVNHRTHDDEKVSEVANNNVNYSTADDAHARGTGEVEGQKDQKLE